MNGHNLFLSKNKKPCIFKAFSQKPCISSDLEPIKNRVPPRFAILEAVYLEALLYFFLRFEILRQIHRPHAVTPNTDSKIEIYSSKYV